MILSRDARTTPATIAKMTGRKEQEVAKAIAEYERAGVIKRYKTIIDWEKAGIEKVIAFIDVKLLLSRDGGFDRISERISRFDEVHSVWLVSGGNDLRVAVEGANIREIGRFVAEKLSTIDGVTATDTHFLLRRYKEEEIIFEDSEEDNRLVVTP